MFVYCCRCGPGCVPEDEAYIPTYLEAFPPLPEKGAPGEKAGEPASAWGSKIRPIKASVITQVGENTDEITHTTTDAETKINCQQNPHFKRQVFHVPLEERRYKDNSQFGEGEEAKVCLDIMQRTGAHIELSLAKDQGLSIMVTGKLDSVMKARKEIVARLQTQVCDRACSLLNRCVKTLLCFCLKILISAGISRSPIIHSDLILL